MRTSPLLYLLSLFLPLTHAQQGPSLKQISLAGSGCPPETFELALQETGGVNFHSFNLTLGTESEPETARCNEEDVTKDEPSKNCVLRLEFGDVPEGLRMLLRGVNVEGYAGLDIGVFASVEASSSWGNAKSEMTESSLVLGSAVGAEFAIPFATSAQFEGQSAACGLDDVVLEVDVSVNLSFEDGVTEGVGHFDVERVILGLDLETCG